MLDILEYKVALAALCLCSPASSSNSLKRSWRIDSEKLPIELLRGDIGSGVSDRSSLLSESNWLLIDHL